MLFKLKYPLFTAMTKEDFNKQLCIEENATFKVQYVCSGDTNENKDIVYISGNLESGKSWFAALSVQAFYLIAAPVATPEQVKSVKEQLRKNRSQKC